MCPVAGTMAVRNWHFVCVVRTGAAASGSSQARVHSRPFTFWSCSPPLRFAAGGSLSSAWLVRRRPCGWVSDAAGGRRLIVLTRPRLQRRVGPYHAGADVVMMESDRPSARSRPSLRVPARHLDSSKLHSDYNGLARAPGPWKPLSVRMHHIFTLGKSKTLIHNPKLPELR